MISFEEYTPHFDTRYRKLPFDENDFLNYIMNANKIAETYGIDYRLDDINFVFVLEELNVELTLDVKDITEAYQDETIIRYGIEKHFTHLWNSLSKNSVIEMVRASTLSQKKPTVSGKRSFTLENHDFLHWKTAKKTIGKRTTTPPQEETNLNTVTERLNRNNIQHNYFEVMALNEICKKITQDIELEYIFGEKDISFLAPGINTKITIPLEQGTSKGGRELYKYHSSVLQNFKTEMQACHGDLENFGIKLYYSDKEKDYDGKNFGFLFTKWSLIETKTHTGKEGK